MSIIKQTKVGLLKAILVKKKTGKETGLNADLFFSIDSVYLSLCC